MTALLIMAARFSAEQREICKEWLCAQPGSKPDLWVSICGRDMIK
jgi:hypothetical protein